MKELLLSLDMFKKKLTDKKAIKDDRERKAEEYHRLLVKEVDEAGKKFVESIIPYLDEYQDIVGDLNYLKVDNSKYYFHISYYERKKLYLDVDIGGSRIYKVEYEKSRYYNGDETTGFPEINKHLIALKHLFDDNYIKNKIANDLLERLS